MFTGKRAFGNLCTSHVRKKTIQKRILENLCVTMLRVIEQLRKGRFVTAIRRPAAPRAVSGSEVELLAAEQPVFAQFPSDLRSQSARSVSAEFPANHGQVFLIFSSDTPGGMWPRVFK